MEDVGTKSHGLALVVDDDLDLCRAVGRYLETSRFDVMLLHDGESCLSALTRTMPDVVCLDLEMPGMGGLKTLEKIKANHRHLPVVILTGDTTVQSAVTAMKQGAYDYLTKPLDLTKMLATLRNAIDRYRMSIRLSQLEREIEGEGYPGVVGTSPPMKKLFREMDRVASTNVTVLISGESGTGKELVAQAIHAASGRNKGPFVALNCAAIPETLQESEFFGHEKGAFTGATTRSLGKFELANGGTLFLDEVAEFSPSLQAKLLRALQERNFQRVGGSFEVSSDFRLLAATNRNLLSEVKAGRFREDLYFRIAVFELDVPPLRDRKDDIPSLAQEFLDQYTDKHNDRRLSLSSGTCELLMAHSWPGNVRELQNIMQRAAVLTGSAQITPEDLPSRLRRQSDPLPLASPEPRRQEESVSRASIDTLPDRHGEPTWNLEQIERNAIQQAIQASQGNLTKVVKQLGIGRTTLYRKLRKYGLR